MSIRKEMKWKIEDIELHNISRFRGELMGIAMLFIILFHISLPQSDAFFGLRRMGNIGVDIFLFLSGVGLWFAWTQHPSITYFFSRRYLRIYPAWLIVACLYYIPDFIHGEGHNYQLGFLAQRRTHFLVYTRHNDALHSRTGLYATYC